MNGKLPHEQKYTSKDKIELEEFRLADKFNPRQTRLTQYRVVASSPGVFRCNIGYTSTGPSDDFGPLIFYPPALISFARQEIGKLKGAMSEQQTKRVFEDSEVPGTAGEDRRP